jgi:DNA-binding MarR family transcriptional regulator
MVRGHYLMTQISNAKPKVREESFGFLVQTLARRLDERMKARLKELDVDLKIFTNLMFLSHKDGITQREIGNHLNFPEYHTSRNVDALIKYGFAERRTDPSSRRSMLIFLTEKGHAKAKQLPPVIQAMNDEILGALTAKERDQLMSLMQKVTGEVIPKED